MLQFVTWEKVLSHQLQILNNVYTCLGLLYFEQLRPKKYECGSTNSPPGNLMTHGQNQTSFDTIFLKPMRKGSIPNQARLGTEDIVSSTTNTSGAQAGPCKERWSMVNVRIKDIQPIRNGYSAIMWVMTQTIRALNTLTISSLKSKD